MNVILNGRVLHASDLKLDINDRSFLYGDGLFETMHYSGDHIRLLDYHLERLHRGCQVLGMDFPSELTASKLEEWCEIMTTREPSINGYRAKLIVWRSAGGLYTPTEVSTNFLLTARAIPTDIDIEKRRVIFSRKVVNHYAVYTEFKTLSSLKYVIAGIEMKEQDADDIIILDVNGNVSEALYSNIFWRTGEEYYTPSLATGCIAGTMRRHVLDKLPSCNVGLFKKEELVSADQVFLSNSLGFFPVKSINGKDIDDTRMPKQLLPL